MKLIPRWHQEKCWSSCIKVWLFPKKSMFILKLELYLAFVAVCVLSPVWVFATPWTVAHQAPLSMGFPRQEYWSGLPFPSFAISLPFSFTKGSSWPRDQTHISCVSCIGRQILYHWVTWEAPIQPYLFIFNILW